MCDLPEWFQMSVLVFFVCRISYRLVWHKS